MSRSVICDSKLQWACKCPHKNHKNVNILEDSDNDSADNDLFQEANIVLITENLSKSELFRAQASKSTAIKISNGLITSSYFESYFKKYERN